MPLGLVGDEQGDSSVHGGLDKAVYAYPSEHYPFWADARAHTGHAEGAGSPDCVSCHMPARTYMQVKRRPIYIEKENNFKE